MTTMNEYFNPAANYRELILGQAGAPYSIAFAWQPSTLSYVALTLDASGNLNVTGGGGGGGGAVTIADGANVVEGATTDLAVITDTNGTISGKLRGLVKLLASVISGGTLNVSGSVSVSNLPATQPISALSLPLPTGAAKDSSLATINTTLGSPFQAGGSIGNAAFGITGALPAGSNNIGHVTVDGTVATADAAAESSLSTIATNTTGIATAANQASEIASLATIAVNTAPLTTGQGTPSAGLTGAIAQAVTNDTPSNYLPGNAQPLSLTTEGRLRVSAQPADTFLDFFGSDFDYGGAGAFSAVNAANPFFG